MHVYSSDARDEREDRHGVLYEQEGLYNRSHLSPESFSSGQGGAGIRRDGAEGYTVVGQEPLHVFDTTFRSAESVLHCEGKS